MKVLLLDLRGVVSAVIVGAAVLYFGGDLGLRFLALLLSFLALGVMASKYEQDLKRSWGVYEYERGWENVIANGIVPVLCAIFSFVPGMAGAYVGAIAATASDKFASEVGVLGSEPVSLFGLKKAKRGESGAVSLLGFLASFDGAAAIGVCAYVLFPGRLDTWGVLLIATIGFTGSFVDSVVGVLEARGLGSKGLTNIICAITGALLGFMFLRI